MTRGGRTTSTTSTSSSASPASPASPAGPAGDVPGGAYRDGLLPAVTPWARLEGHLGSDLRPTVTTVDAGDVEEDPVPAVVGLDEPEAAVVVPGDQQA